MRIIEIKALNNGAHRNQTCDGVITPPEGFAVVPDDMEIDNFPFGEVTAEEIDGVMTVTKWVAGTIPSASETVSEPTATDDIMGILIEQEYRLTLLELGITEEE